MVGAIAFAVATLAFDASASAHTLGLSQGHVTATRGNEVVIEVAFARGDYLKLGETPFLSIEDAGGASCPIERTGERVVEDGVAIELVGRCGAAPKELRFELWTRLGANHRLLFRANERDVVCHAASPNVALVRTEATAGETTHRTSDALALGFEHVALGYDHLLFLLGLALASVVARESKRRLFVAVTAFTLTHTASLAFAFRGAVSIPERPVEVLIACTIGFVGFEVRRSPTRGASPFACALFGCVHGLGFGTAFRGALGTTTALTLGLATLGVELAQVCGVLVALGLLALPFARDVRARRAIAMALFVVGLALATWRALR